MSGDRCLTPKKKKKTPLATFVRRSPRLMEKHRLPFSCSSSNPISLSDDEQEVEHEVMDEHEKQTHNSMTLHVFDLLFPISDLINGVHIPLATELPLEKVPLLTDHICGVDNLDAEEEYGSGFESDKERV